MKTNALAAPCFAPLVLAAVAHARDPVAWTPRGDQHMPFHPATGT